MKTKITLILIPIILALVSFSLFAAKSSGLQSTSFEVAKAFQIWSSQENKLYSSPEEMQYRMNVFGANYNKIKEINNQNTEFKTAINSFSDLTTEEFVAKYTGDMSTEEFSEFGTREEPVAHRVPSLEIESFDWRTKGNVVNPIKNQLSCGSCWTFAAIASFETAYALKSGNLLTFSESVMVDCDTRNYGCSGGNCKVALEFLRDQGTVLESQYPYVPADKPCDKARFTNPYKSTGVSFQSPSDMNSLKASVAQGPNYVSIYASLDSFRFYKEGIYNDVACQDGHTNHAVTILGYHIEPENMDNSYWIMRNSWGGAWGLAGYMKMKMYTDSKGLCLMYTRFGRVIID